MVVLLMMFMAVTAPTAVTSTEYHVYEEVSEVFSGINRIPPVEGNWVKCEWPLDIKDCMKKMEAKEGRKTISEAQKKIKAMLKGGSEMLQNKDAEDMQRMKSQVEEWKKVVKDIAHGKSLARKEGKQLQKKKKKRIEKKKLEADRLKETSALEKTGQENMFQGKKKNSGNQDKEKMERVIVKKENSVGEQPNKLEEMTKVGG